MRWMRPHMLPSIVVLAALISCGLADDKPKVIVVLVEGFANWYLDNSDLELAGFKEVERHGVRADYLLPEFPTVSKPNFFSLFTGLYPENHQVSGDIIYDEREDRFVHLDTPQAMLDAQSYWNKSELIWTAAQRQSVPTSLFGWPFCPPSSDGLRCTPWSEEFEKDLGSKIADILRLIDHHHDQFIMIRYLSADRQGKTYGPHSGRNHVAVQEISTFLYELQHALSSYELWKEVNLIVASTSGITATSVDKYYFLDDFLPLDLLERVVNSGAYMWIYPKDDKDFQIYQALDNVIPHTKLYWKDQFPSRWRLGGAPHLAPLLLIAEEGYGLYCRDASKQYPPPDAVTLTQDYFPKGSSGYDNASPDMKAVFLARGPAFKQHERTPWLRAVDLYPMLCRLLQITCHQHDGDEQRVQNTLNHSSRLLASKLFLVSLFVLLACQR